MIVAPSNHNYSVPVYQILLILFIFSKINGTIDWSWWWVLSPIWIPLALGVTLAVLGAIFKIFKDAVTK